MIDRARSFVAGLAAGETNAVALAIGVTCLVVILGLRQWRPGIPGILVAVVGSTIVSAVFDLSARSGIAVVGPLPVGLPPLTIPPLAGGDILALIPAALGIALVSATDTSVLSRTFSLRRHEEVDQDRELLALGGANLATGLLSGMPVSSSASRTPVAEAAGARSQLTSVVGALAIAVMLVADPGLLEDLPTATLAAVVIAAGLSLVEIGAIARLWRLGSSEFWLALASFLGVAFVGVIEGVFFAVALSLLAFIRRAWWPHDAVMGRADGVKGYHDLTYYPEARQVPGLRPVPLRCSAVLRQRRRLPRPGPRTDRERGGAGPLGRRGGRADHRRRYDGRRDARHPRGRARRRRHHPRVRRAQGPGPGDSCADTGRSSASRTSGSSRRSGRRCRAT